MLEGNETYLCSLRIPYPKLPDLGEQMGGYVKCLVASREMWALVERVVKIKVHIEKLSSYMFVGRFE